WVDISLARQPVSVSAKQSQTQPVTSRSSITVPNEPPSGPSLPPTGPTMHISIGTRPCFGPVGGHNGTVDGRFGPVDGWFGTVNGWFGPVNGWFGTVDGGWSAAGQELQ
ncbi:UNVERIFIED_CONTAM: hypothetical protein DES50_1011204, partial [Williamsia faeni]